ncbi:hypothetical protein [Paenibacillus wulumuqiensis]|uniref:hypothetical protein n=1 Tax=Paenibacillus wulumuqiensis TaxID=1567107 RepID=UPI0006979B29|nr:hypothetical protein [Paenibacillus wulumuqiensis]
MNHVMTIREIVEQEIQAKNYTISSFSKLSGINRGVLSSTLHGSSPRPISINQLDKMGQALGKPEGWLYEQFIEESCLQHTKVNWRKVRPLLLRCIELDRTQSVDQLITWILQDSFYLTHIFELAEQLTADEQLPSALPLYRSIVQYERNYQSEQLAISQYRIFQADTGEMIGQNFKAALVFQPFCANLPEDFMLDALLKLANIYFTVKEWKHMSDCADQLMELSHAIYARQCDSQSAEKSSLFRAARPLVVYYGQSYLMKFTVAELTQNYEEADYYLPHFADLSWFHGLDDEGRYEVEKFKMYAAFNALNMELLRGNCSRLPIYKGLLQQHPGEILASMNVILQSANMYGYDITEILEAFHDQIYSFESVNLMNQLEAWQHNYKDLSIGVSRYIDLYYELALYHFNQKLYDENLAAILNMFECVIQQYGHEHLLHAHTLLKKMREMNLDLLQNQANT